MASHNSTFSIYIYCRLLLKRKYVWDQWMRKSKALNVNDSSGEKNMLGCDSLKEISSVSSIQGWQRGSRQMHSSAIYKGYYCIKINVKMQQNLKVVPTYHKFLLKIPFITIQQYATYFFFFLLYVFSKYVFMSVLSLRLILDSVLPLLFSFCVIIAPFVFFQEYFLPLFRNSVALVWKWKSKITGDNENREQDSWHEWYMCLRTCCLQK